jgi:hypothetical protein
MRRVAVAVVALTCSLAAFAATATPARASYSPPLAPYIPAAPTPEVPGLTYPAAWNDGADVLTKARIAGRFLPALRVLGTIGLGITAFDVGWHIGGAADHYFNLSGTIGDTLAGTTTSGGYLVEGAMAWTFRTAGQTTIWDHGATAADGWYLTFRWCSPAPSCGSLAHDVFPAGVSGMLGAYHPAGGPVSVGGGNYVWFISEADMTAAMRLKPITATAFGAKATQLNSSYTPPVPVSSTDRTNARAALGAPVAGQNTSGQYVDSAGNVLSGGQVVAQSDANCHLDSSYCVGGANDPSAPGGPLSDVAVMPDCVGAVVAVCTSALDAAGLTGSRVFTDLGLAGADVTKPAGAVVTQSSAFGSSVTKALPLTFTRNPTTMPLLLPQPLITETYDQYITRLQTLGYVGVASFNQLSDLAAEPQLGPDAPVRIRVTTTTGAQVLSPFAWPSTPPRINPSSSITVDRNPATMPAPAGALPPPGTSPPAGGIDFTPITGLSLGCKFPFGFITCYAKQVTDWFRVDPVAPEFVFHFPQIGAVDIPGGGVYDVDLGNVGVGDQSLSHYMALLRGLISAALWIGAVWVLATRFLGFHAAGDPAEAIDD